MTDPELAPELPEARLRELVDHVPATVFTMAHQASVSFEFLSDHVERLTGHPVAYWMGHPDRWLQSVHPADRDRVANQWAFAVSDGVPFAAEFRMITRQGSIVWVHETAEPARDGNGRIVSWQGIAYDITGRMAAEDALVRSEARYRALVERLPAVVYADSDERSPRSLYVSPNSLAILGYTPGDYLGDRDLWARSIHPDDRERVTEAWSEVVQTREPFHAEYRMVRPDGRDVWVRDSSIPVPGDSGSTLFWQGVMLDITPQKLIEQQLRRSEESYRLLVEQVPAVVYEMDRDDERRTLYVSPHVEILGYSRQEWLDQPDIWTELLHEDDRETELAAHDRHAETGEPWSREYRLIAEDGHVVWVRDQARLIGGGATGGARWQGVMLDITLQKEAEHALRNTNAELELRVLTRTSELSEANEMMTLEIGERKRAEAELRDAEVRYRTLVEDLPAAVYFWEANWDDATRHPSDGSPYMSPQIETIVGFTSAEWDATGFWRSRLHPHDRDHVLAQAARSERTGAPFNEEYRYLAKDGRVVWVLDRATLRTRKADGQPATFQGVMLDITARKEAEEKAADVESRYRHLAEQGPVMSYVYLVNHDADPPVMTVEYISPQTSDVVGYPLDHWAGDPTRWLEMVHPDDRDRLASIAERGWRTGEPWTANYRLIAGDGRVVWLRDQSRAVARDEAGRPTRFQGMLLDVTVEREEALSLEAAERTLRQLIEGSPAIAWAEVIELDTGRRRYGYFSPQVEQLLGYTPQELLDESGHFARLIHPDDRERIVSGARLAEASGSPWEGRFRLIARDGSERFVHSTSRPGPIDHEARTITWYGVTIEVAQEREPSDRT